MAKKKKVVVVKRQPQPQVVVIAPQPSGGGGIGLAVVGLAGVAGGYYAWKKGYLDGLIALIKGNGGGDGECPDGYVLQDGVCVQENIPPNGELPEGMFRKSGVVADMDFYRIAGAKVQFYNRDTLIKYVTSTDQNGEFYVQLDCGYYDIDITAAGFGALHQAYKNFTLNMEYPASTYNMMEQSIKLETLYLTKSNCAISYVKPDPYCGVTTYQYMSWNLVSLLREKGYTVPDNKVDTSQISGSVEKANGYQGWWHDHLTLVVKSDGHIIGSQYIGQGHCPAETGDTVMVNGVGRANTISVELTTDNGGGYTGEFRKPNLAVMVQWYE